MAPDYEIPDPAKHPLLSEEELQDLIEKRQAAKIEAQKKQARFANRKSFDELLQKLLNGDIFDLFVDKY